ncbi:MAG: hypothetical protein AABX19_01820 [Nanoarchaeota archaeon]
MYNCNKIYYEDKPKRYHPPQHETGKDSYEERIDYWIDITPEIIKIKKFNIVLPKKPRIGTIEERLN